MSRRGKWFTKFYRTRRMSNPKFMPTLDIPVLFCLTIFSFTLSRVLVFPPLQLVIYHYTSLSITPPPLPWIHHLALNVYMKNLESPLSPPRKNSPTPYPLPSYVFPHRPLPITILSSLFIFTSRILTCFLQITHPT